MHPALSTRELPRFIRDLLGSVPAAGSGVHAWLYRAACALKPWRDDSEVESLLSAMVQGCGRIVRASEIRDAVRHAGNDWTPGADAGRVTLPPAKWPAKDWEAIAVLAKDGIECADLWEFSPWRLDEGAPDAEEAINVLYPADALLCCGPTLPGMATRTRGEWSGILEKLQFIVPSPMSARNGTNQEGETSPRCLANTGPRRFLVCECDFKRDDANIAALLSDARTTQDLCAAVLLKLAGHAPLVLVVNSGGKSLHGWFAAQGQEEKQLRQFMAHAVRLGADPMTWTRCQAVRMPEGRRDNGRCQRIEFFNPGAMPSPQQPSLP